VDAQSLKLQTIINGLHTTMELVRVALGVVTLQGKIYQGAWWQVLEIIMRRLQ
jgi:hypothetical protein